MRRSTAELLAGFYPREWRNRFGVEFVDLLEGQPLGADVVWDVAVAAMTEHVRYRTTAEARMAYA